jgi:hypothetical protein
VIFSVIISNYRVEYSVSFNLKKSAKSHFFTDTQQMSLDFQVIRLEIKKPEPISIQFNAKRKAALTNSFSAK